MSRPDGATFRARAHEQLAQPVQARRRDRQGGLLPSIVPPGAPISPDGHLGARLRTARLVPATHSRPIPRQCAAAQQAVRARYEQSVPDTLTFTGTVAVTQQSQTSSTASHNYTGRWPTSVDSTDKRLLDQTGTAWMGVGDSAWSLVGQLSTSDITTYLTDIAAKGVNLVLFSAPEAYYTDNTPDSRNQSCDDPFAGTAFQSALNDAYWDVVDHAVTTALSLGITVLICPQYLGINDTEGWRDTITTAYTADPQFLTDYGVAIANRYGGFPNVMWLIGHDDAALTTTTRDASEAIAAELSSRTSHLITVGAARGAAGSGTWSTSTVAYDFDTVYFDNATPGEDTAGIWASSACIWVEGWYEQEHSIAVGAQTLREQVWEPFCAGSSASIFGNNPRWHFGLAFPGKPGFSYSGTWQQSINTATFNEGTVHLSRFGSFLGAVSWQGSLPDTTGTFLTAGTGFARFSTSIGIAYQTAAASITLDTTELAGTGNVKIRRYDPTSGAFTTVASSEAQNAARSITHPGNNAAGAPDWVYVVELTNDVSGTVAVTQQNQTPSASGTISFVGSVAVTQANQTSAATGVESFAGSTAVTQANQTSAATGVESFTATVAVTQANQTSSATGTSGSSPSGTAAVTQQNQTSTAAGTISFTATVAVTQQNQTSAATGVESFTGTVARTQANQTSSATGVESFTSSVAVTQANQTSSATGTRTVTFTATVAVTQQNQTVTAVGNLPGAYIPTVNSPTIRGRARTTITGRKRSASIPGRARPSIGGHP